MAQRYLDRTTSNPPAHHDLPSAHWRETGPQLSVAQSGQPRCGTNAIEYVEPFMPYSLGLVLRNPESCIRPRGHDGCHASKVVRHAYRKTQWKALAWGCSVEPTLSAEPEPPVGPAPSAVLLSPDFNARSPLWPSSSGTDAMVSQSLLRELIAWQRGVRLELRLGNRLAYG